MDALSQETIATLGMGVVVIGFLWSLHRDIAGLRDRISRLEGLYEGLRDSVAGLQERFAGLESRVAGLERAVAGLAARVTGLETAVAGVRDSVNRFERRHGDGPTSSPVAGD